MRGLVHTGDPANIRVSVLAVCCALGLVVCGALAQPAPTRAPLNPDFVKYQREYGFSRVVSTTADGRPLGYIPSPVDTSHIRPRSPAGVRAAEALPAAFDLRDCSPSRVTPIRNQGSAGTCWAHAAYASLESCLLPGQLWDFSENNLKNTNGFDVPHTYGGNWQKAAAYLTRWSGPVREEDDPYNDSSGYSPLGLPVQKHVQEVVCLANDRDEIKWAVYSHGAVSCSYHHDDAYYNHTTSAYYCMVDKSANHSAAIVGWDDAYSRNNFGTAPSTNGAWILRNSWGTDWGEGGYAYISYWDASLDEFALFGNAEPTNNYDIQHFYDPLGWTAAWGGYTPSFWAANLFTTQQAEALCAIGFYMVDSVGQYEAYIYRNVSAFPTSGDLAASVSGIFPYAGYTTVSLPAAVNLSAGETFAIVMRLETPNYPWPAAAEQDACGTAGSNAATASPGQSFWSYDGTNWADLTDLEDTANFCIKAFADRPGTTGHSVLISEGPAGSPNPVASRRDVACSVSAVDSLGHDLLYEWSAVDADGTPIGSFDDPTVRTPVWTAPENATGADLAYTISVTVACSDDPDVNASAQFTQAVNSGAVAEHIVTITQGPSGSPNPCAPGGQVQCTVTAHDSIDGHTLAYSWSATGPDGLPANHFDDATVRNPVWTAPAHQAGAGSDADDYQIAVTVLCADDGGVRAFGSFTQRVQQLVHEVVITGGPSGDPNPCRPGDEVRCSVGAEDVPEGHALLYAWEATGGSFDDPTSQTPTWTAPEIATENTVEYTLTVVVTCAEDTAVSATASYQQRVAPVVEHTVTITDGPTGDPASAASGGNVACSVTAEDSRDGHVVTYSWTATGPGGGASGSFSNATAQNPTWTAPENRTDAAIEYEITVVAACGAYPLVNDSASFTVAVGPVTHAVTITDGPTTADATLLPGGATRCTVTAEDSRQGHTLAYAWTATDADGDEVGNFDDAASASPMWTAPANTTGVPMDYTIGVTVSCSGNAAVRDTGTVSVSVLPVLEHHFDSGMRMIGIPAVPIGAQGLVDVLAAPDIVRWNPATRAYEPLGTGEPHVPGCGYWGRFGAQTDVAIPGTSVLGTLDYPVATGWNIVSSPYDYDLNLDAITDSQALLPFAWTDQGDGYRLVANLQDCLNQVDNTIHPWWGYWVYATRAGTVSWSPSHVAADGTAELLQIGPADRERGGWQLQLVAEAAGRVDACNYFGVAGEQTAQALSIPNPPSLPDSVDIYFPSESGPMAADIRTAAAGALSWQFVVTCRVDAPVKLSLPDLTAVPAEYRLTLRDLATDRTVNMRTTHTYSYSELGERRFRIEATRGNGNTLVVSGVSAQQVGDATMSIAYTLSASAEVSIEVRNISGRLVRSVSYGPAQAGLNTAAWDLRNAGGARIPSGVYLGTITARADDGTQASVVRTLNVSR